MRDDLIDYGITVLGHGQVTEKFAVTLGPPPTDQHRVDTVASVFVLGSASAGDGTCPQHPGHRLRHAVAGGGRSRPRAGGSAALGARRPASDSRTAGWWIAALVLGALLDRRRLVLALRGVGASRPRRAARRGRDRPPARATAAVARRQS